MTEEQMPELFFDNPLKLPLEKLYLKLNKVKDGEEQVKALDKFWVSERFYPCFSPIPEDINNDEEKQKWLKRATTYIKSLLFILDLPFYKFWSHILYDKAITEMLDSFLRNSVPCYLPQPCGDYEELYSQIYDLVFQIFTKIFTPKQSETEHITPETLGALLKDNKVITNYTIWDLSKLYGHTDDGTVESQIKFAYEMVPNLAAELPLVVNCVADIFEAVGTAAYEEDAPTEKIVTRLTLLLYDNAFALNMFLKIYQPFKDVCVQENLVSRILHTYDSEIPLLYSLMRTVFIDDDNPGYDRVDNSRVELVETTHSLLTYCVDKILQTQDSEQNQKSWINYYLRFITSMIDHNEFLKDYNKVFPVIQDIEMLILICPNIDKDKCNNIIESVKKHETEEESKRKLEEEEEKANDLELNENGFEHQSEDLTLPEDVLLDSKISELIDVFPDFGDGFLEQCLISMNMDSQSVIMAILEDNLPADLAKLDRSLPRIPPEEPEPGLSVEAAYIGKKPSGFKDLSELLNDKSHVQEQKLRFQMYSTLAEDSLYDDDYDDRYDDDFAVGVDRDDNEEVMKPRRRGGKPESEEEEEETTEYGEQNSNLPRDENGKPRDAFCEDPALIRARREERYQQQRQRRAPNTASANKPKDVVGKPKGQGQEKTVVQNREKKTVNKSARANHNRRSGAQWKRSRGMIPS